MNSRVLLAKLMFFRTLPADIMYWTCKDKETVNQDLIRYTLKETPYKSACTASLNYCLLYGNTFRNVFYFRMNKHPVCKWLSRMMLPPVATVEIGGNIAGGLRVNHMNAVVYPHSAGKNLTVGPNAVIGKGPKKLEGTEINAPVIGDDVYILPGAIVTGGVSIGDRACVGAGTIVLKDIPAECTMVGNPGEILNRK